MKSFIAFTRKEFLQLLRTGKLLILLVIFILFGIMNPAIAKMTPWMMKLFSESFTDAGMTISMNTEITALTSWAQFYKNIPLALIIFLLLSANIFTSEYQKGTLIPILTKGMPRFQVLLSKAFTLIAVWSAGYWLCYGITYGYNFYFWDNCVASHLFLAATCIYLVGIWTISLLLLASSLFSSTSGVLAVTGGIFVLCYFISFIPSLLRYLPVRLLSASALLTGAVSPPDYVSAIYVTVLLSLCQLLLAIFFFNKKGI